MAKRRFNGRRFFVVITVFFLTLYLSHAFIEQRIILSKLNQKTQDLTSELNRLIDIGDYYRINIERAQTQESLERIAREKLRLARRGEIVFVDIGPKE